MPVAKSCLAALLLILACTSKCVAEGDEKTDAKLLDFKVRTVDASNQPIAAALIEVWQVGGEPMPPRPRRVSVGDANEIRTGADGRAAFSFPTPAKKATNRTLATYICITAQAKDYLVTRNDPIRAISGDHFDIALTLRRLVSVEGRVVDQAGRPVADATVFHTGNATPRTETRTDADGRFQLAGLLEGKSPVFVEHPAFHFHGQLLDTSAKSHELKLMARDQTPAPMRTLPPLRSHEEELKLACQVIRPALELAPAAERVGWFQVYAFLEPWYAMDYVSTHMSKADKIRFVVQMMPQLYAAEPDEALTALESLDYPENYKAVTLIMTVAELPKLSRQRKLDLLDRAAQHARAITEPGGRVHRLSSVALRLFRLGETDAAKQIVETIAPLAKQLPPKDNAAACAVAGEAISLFDLPAGVRLTESVGTDNDDYYCTQSLIHIAARLADQQPAEAERIAVAAAQASYKAYLKNRDHRDPTDEDLTYESTFDEMWLLPVCYRMVSADADRAERIAKAIHNPHLRAYAMGTVARALTPVDQPRARKTIVAAFDLLTEASRNPDPRWRHWQLNLFHPSSVAGALLPVVEQIDPTLVRECLWRAVSFRLHRSADEYVHTMDPEFADACLAALVGRYDRELAEAIFPKPDRTTIPGNNLQMSRPMDALMLVDFERPFQESASGAAEGASALSRARKLGGIIELVPIELPYRWNAFCMKYHLWVPDDEHFYRSSFPW